MSTVPPQETNTVLQARSFGRDRGRRWADLPLRRKGLLVVAFPLTGLFLAATMFALAGRKNVDSQASVDRSLAVDAQLRRVLGLVIDIETGIRGFLLTRQEPFLEPAETARAELPTAFDELGSLIADAGQRTRLAGLRQLVDARLKISDELRRLPPADGARAPELLRLLGEGKAATDRIRAEVNAMESRQAGLLEREQSRAARANDLARTAAAAGALLGLIGGIGSAVLFARGITRRITDLERGARLLEQGLPVHAPPAGADEIGRLGRALCRASELLRKREAALREREATLRAVFDASPDIITITGLDGTLRSANPALQRVRGYELTERLGRGTFELVHPDDKPVASAAIDQLLSGEAEHVAFRVRSRHADGRWIVLESQASLLTDAAGGPTGIVAVTRDVTEQTRLEEAQQQAREAAEAANRSKTEFLSRMSHELRTPLNAVLGFAQLLELEDLSPDQRESVADILKAGRHLLDLIDEVLDITQIEAGRLSLSPEPVPVLDVILETLRLIRPVAATSKIHLLPPGADACDGYVLADRQRLKQILLNLLSNAVKYNRPGGTVAVSCETVEGGRLGIDVADTGPGIRPEHVPLLFTPFERLGAEHSGVEGTGIGLAVSRRLAEAMGGSLNVRTAVGRGSTFRVELQEAEGPVERYERLNGGAGPTGTSQPLSQRGTVLYIEDNLINLKLVERILAQRSGVQVVGAMQGRLGLELAREHRPLLILLDLHLPDMGGDEVLRRLRDDPATAATPVVMVSADATSGQIQRLLAAGAAAYLTKPLDVRELLRLLDEVLTDVPG